METTELILVLMVGFALLVSAYAFGFYEGLTQGKHRGYIKALDDITQAFERKKEHDEVYRRNRE